MAAGHVAALKAFENKCGLGIYNMGTSNGYSVLDVVNAFMKVYGVNVPYSIKSREDQAILQLVIAILPRPRQNLAGKSNMELRKCVVIAGTGRELILQDINNYIF